MRPSPRLAVARQVASERRTLAGGPDEHRRGDEDGHEDHAQFGACTEDGRTPRMSVSNLGRREQTAGSETAADYHPEDDRWQHPVARRMGCPVLAGRVSDSLPEQDRGNAADDDADHQCGNPGVTSREPVPSKTRHDRRANPHGNDDGPAKGRAVERADIEEAVADPPQRVGEPDNGKRRGPSG
jgi:hypothetical protein